MFHRHGQHLCMSSTASGTSDSDTAINWPEGDDIAFGRFRARFQHFGIIAGENSPSHRHAVHMKHSVPSVWSQPGHDRAKAAQSTANEYSSYAS
jgi:hypothetical protein